MDCVCILSYTYIFNHRLWDDFTFNLLRIYKYGILTDTKNKIILYSNQVTKNMKNINILLEPEIFDKHFRKLRQ